MSGPQPNAAFGGGNALPKMDGAHARRAPLKMALPKRGSISRYILTSAQNNTHVDPKTWASLKTLAKHYGAEVIISKFTYNKTHYQQALAKPGSEAADGDGIWYDPQILPYCPPDGIISDVLLAPHLLWVARANVIPTSAKPLANFQTYSGEASAIIPHARLAMEACPHLAGQHQKHLYTTGCVTQRNYIQRKAGMLAEHHHCYGGLLVEVLPNGAHFVRQLEADSRGAIHDLDVRAKGGRISTGHRAEGIVYGDIHAAQANVKVLEATWGKKGSVWERLRPKHQVLHDLYDMYAQNHHDKDGFRNRYRKHFQGKGSVSAEIAMTKKVLAYIAKPDATTYVVRSNHDDALDRWLERVHPRDDLDNAPFWFSASLYIVEAIRKNKQPHLLEWALREFDLDDFDEGSAIHFLTEDSSLEIADVECGQHGHIGPNGTRGSPQSFARSGRKMTVGHFHSAGIVNGVFVAGTCAEPDYVQGPRSHSASHVVIYPNGKRAILTMANGKFWA